MCRLLVFIIILASATTVFAEPLITARVAEVQNPLDAPYRSAVLTVDNQSSTIIRTVRLRCRTGGPTIIIPASIPPGSKADLNAPLPAVNSSQLYHVELLETQTPDAKSFASDDVRITFPSDLLANEVIYDEQAYGDFQGDFPSWRRGLISAVMIGTILMALALTAALFIPRPMLRLAVVTIIIIAAGVTAWLAMDRQQILLVREFPSTDKTTGSLVVVTCRRSDTFKTDDADLKPIYENPGQMQNDKTVIVVGKSLTCPIKSNQILLFRKAPSQ